MDGKESNKQQINTSDENNSEDNVNSSFCITPFPLDYEMFTHIRVCMHVCMFFFKKNLFFFKKYI